MEYVCEMVEKELRTTSHLILIVEYSKCREFNIAISTPMSSTLIND